MEREVNRESRHREITGAIFSLLLMWWCWSVGDKSVAARRLVSSVAVASVRVWACASAYVCRRATGGPQSWASRGGEYVVVHSTVVYGWHS